MGRHPRGSLHSPGWGTGRWWSTAKVPSLGPERFACWKFTVESRWEQLLGWRGEAGPRERLH